jgi:hypothetical protein
LASHTRFAFVIENTVPKKTRKTLRKQISELAKTNPFEAVLLASRGRIFSQLETDLCLFHELQERNSAMEHGDMSSFEKYMKECGKMSDREIELYRQAISKSFQEYRARIANMVIDLIIRRDSVKIREIADSLDLLRKGTPNQDSLRQEILSHQVAFSELKMQIKISEWAELLNWNKDDCENGHPHLRRILTELHIPYIRVRRTKKS